MMNVAKHLLVILICWPWSIWALEIVKVDVDKRDGIYYIVYRAVVEVPADQLLAAVYDYQDYASLSPIVKGVELIQLKGGISRLSVTLRPCVIGVCRKVTKVSDVITKPDGQIEFLGVDGAGDFKSSRELIRVELYYESKERALFSYRAQLNPSFFVPPIIGRWIVSRQVRRELGNTLNTLEKRYLER